MKSDLTKLPRHAHVLLYDRMGNHRTARTVCALIDGDMIFLRAPLSLVRYMPHLTLRCGLTELTGICRPASEEEQTSIEQRFVEAFPNHHIKTDLAFLIFIPD